MNWKDYSSLKSGSKVSFVKEKVTTREAVAEVTDDDGNVTTAGVSSQNAYTVLERKSYNPDTGAESTVEDRLSLVDMEQKKAQLTAEKDRAQAELTEVGKMITDIKAL